LPYVNVKLIGNLTKEQKTEIAKGITDILCKVAGKKPETTYVVFDEYSGEDWAVGGKLHA
jgi:4-oxalocrotonate tautomerase